MTARIEQAFERLLKNIAVVLRAAGKPTRFFQYLLDMGRVETFITEGFKRTGLEVARLAHFTSIAGQAGKVDTLAEMLLIFVNDVLLTCDHFIPSCKVGMPSGGFRIQAVEADYLSAFMANISIGVKGKDAVVFRRYAHNNHLPSQLIRSPGDFLPSALSRYLAVTENKTLYLVLEAGSQSVTSLTDLTVQVAVVITARIGGSTIILRKGDLIELPVTFDSKVCFDTVTALKKERTMTQQFNLFVSDRFSILDELLGELNDVHNASSADKAGFLDEIVPAMFAHYVFTPSTFIDNGHDLSKFYREQMRKMLGEFAQVQKDSGHLTMSQDDLELCIDAIERFADAHFGNGDFIKNTSQIRL